MSAIAKAIELYGPDFPRIHGIYLERGYCYSEPELLALARPCNTSDYMQWVDVKGADAWWVELVIGPGALQILMSHLPFRLQKIGWRRDFKGKPVARFYNLAKLTSTIAKHG